MAQLVKDVQSAERKARRLGLTPVFRLNGTSDIRWETIPVERDGETFPNIFTAFPLLTFYDYTKLTNRRNIPANYHLTFSRSEENGDAALAMLWSGFNVATLFDTLPKTFWGFPVIDGTEHDLRFMDPKGVIVGLVPKGKAKSDTSGFVVQLRKAS